ncbi:GTPase domain-containing protein [Ornithinimicrobium sp. LYQ103]|uniref:GTPase domain-containing protein n=1 Tax=Ornithinimicrobium sp. LYQ103 TaxID=3378796 RepID=UPI00385332BA
MSALPCRRCLVLYHHQQIDLAHPTEGRILLAVSLAVASALVAEAIGLLLEDDGLDDTLAANDAVALVQDLAGLREVPPAGTGSITALLATHLDRTANLVRVREEVIGEARLLGLEASWPQMDAAQRILEQAPSSATIESLSELPVEAASLALHQFDLEHRTVKRASSDVQDAWRSLQTRVRPSALTDLDLAAESRALRDSGGWLGWLRGAPSEDARERVKPHLAPQLSDLSAAHMAPILDRVLAYDKARGSLRAQVAAAHPWVGWAFDVETGEVRERQAASLRWLLAEVEAGNLGAAERALLTDASWRRLLTRDAGVRWAKVLKESVDVADPGAMGSHAATALNRFVRWLARPPFVTSDEFDELHRELTSVLTQIASALVVVQASLTEAALAAQVNAVVELSQGSFGPADENRPRFRAIVEQVTEDVERVRSFLAPLRPQHSQLASLLGELREALGRAHDDLRGQAPARGPLRVAIAGRTKAGKTTLRKVLTRDPSEEGIGRGAHRTTRSAEAFSWDQITFVDTPGVSAKDDDYDAATAAQVCRDADAVVWMFAESLHDEEAQILQALLTIKPVLVVYNAKGRVNSALRLSLFVRNPRLTFADESGHAERSRQMAAAAGVHDPMFLAVHAGAARRALLAGGETHPAWAASRIPVLESELRRVLSSQAQGLRSLRLADQVRTPLLVAAGRAASVVESLRPRCATIAHRVEREERDLRGAVLRAVDQARVRTRKKFASLSAALPGWLEEVDGRGDSLNREWSVFLADLQIDAVLTGIAESLRADARTSGLLLDREDKIEEKLQRSRFGGTRRRGIPLVTRAWRLLRRLVGLALRNAPRFSREARMGPIGWAALALDVLATSGRAIVEEVSESRIDRRQWERSADQASRRELEKVRRQVAGKLDRIEAALLTSVDHHFAQSRTEIARILQGLSLTDQLQATIAAAVREVDRLTVERLVQLGGLPPGQVMDVDRAPNLHLRVTVASNPEEIAQWLRSVLDGCNAEAVTVTRGHWKRAQAKELDR